MKKVLSIVLCVLWMGFIFYNSSNNGEISEDRSHALLNSIKNQYHKLKSFQPAAEKPQNNDMSLKESSKGTKAKTSKAVNSKKEEEFNKILRKNAHAFEYFILAIVVGALLFSFNMKGKSALIYIMFICLFYAVMDEFHQIFVSGRSSLVSDVLIDFLGSVIGIFVFYLFYYKVYRMKFK
ncbi:VanZ family protein [Clostridium magnum]|uniref:VanZ like family protein n=1 Tax=Clostridium magnum DSM 2767 TaxID=1121326 RepID=A0A162RDY3_9CLOT|nr:VanZ family protein [Clostridium magnum]KZL89760.1 VanZ like family protein [Clostridium magnum DSM 2767]SHH66045.1 VanZ like family protein [Clostridium magnum DSM 2767]